jgi:hypothetical protein
MWIGNKHPCDEVDMEFFYAATTITVRNGRIAGFWHLPWLDRRKPKDIGPSIFAISTRKNFEVHKAYLHEFWIAKLNTSADISLNQINEFVDLWMRVNEVRLVEGTLDHVIWKITNSAPTR